MKCPLYSAPSLSFCQCNPWCVLRYILFKMKVNTFPNPRLSTKAISVSSSPLFYSVSTQRTIFFSLVNGPSVSSTACFLILSGFSLPWQFEERSSIYCNLSFSKGWHDACFTMRLSLLDFENKTYEIWCHSLQHVIWSANGYPPLFFRCERNKESPYVKAYFKRD